MVRARRVARRTARRTTRRVVRRRAFIAAPLMFRRPFIRRPLGTLLIMGATAGVAYKLGKADAQRIQEYTGVPPEELKEEDLKEAMQDLGIESQPLDAQDHNDLQASQASSASAPSTPQAAATKPASPGNEDYIAELEKLGDLRDRGLITNEEFEAKKKQILGL